MPFTRPSRIRQTNGVLNQQLGRDYRFNCEITDFKSVWFDSERVLNARLIRLLALSSSMDCVKAALHSRQSRGERCKIANKLIKHFEAFRVECVLKHLIKLIAFTAIISQLNGLSLFTFTFFLFLFQNSRIGGNRRSIVLSPKNSR